MLMYHLHKSDLKGDIKGFPKEIIQKMLERQEEQNGSTSIMRFQRNRTAIAGGFDWSSSEEGFDFWNSVIANRSFDTFFKKYPKNGNNKEKSD